MHSPTLNPIQGSGNSCARPGNVNSLQMPKLRERMVESRRTCVAKLRLTGDAPLRKEPRSGLTRRSARCPTLHMVAGVPRKMITYPRFYVIANNRGRSRIPVPVERHV